jgi:biotin carboxyl carrier protein
MTETDREALDAIARAADELVPQLTERLERHGLGELEVRRGDVRVRVARRQLAAPPATDRSSRPTGARTEAGLAGRTEADGGRTTSLGVPSPAVGFFVYAEGLGPGLSVEKGDALGQIEVLGVRHDVRAPRRGTVRHLVAESGEAVEYGQVVVEMEPVEATR